MRTPLVGLVGVAGLLAVAGVACGPAGRRTASPALETPTATLATATIAPAAPTAAVATPTPGAARPGPFMAFAATDVRHQWISHGTFVEAASGLTLGDGELSISSDGGLTWSELYRGEVWPDALAFADARHGWMAGCVRAPGTLQCATQVFRTDDGGARWQRLDTYAGGWVVAMAFVTGTDGWLLANPCMPSCRDARAALYATRDAGDSWRAVPLPATGPPESLARIDATGAAIVTRHEVLVTDDAGADWASTPNPCAEPQLHAGVGFQGGPTFFIDPMHGWLGCTAPGAAGTSPEALYATADGGRTWHVVAESPLGRAAPSPPGVGVLSGGGGISDIYFFDEMNGWIALDGPAGALFATTDGGYTWTRADDTSGGGVDHVRFVTPDDGWAWGARLLHTSDGGQHWQSVSIP